MASYPITPLSKTDSAEGESPEVAGLLQHIKDVSKQMREHEAKVVELGKDRRQTVTKLRTHGITWRKIAEWAGTTDQALYKHANREK